MPRRGETSIQSERASTDESIKKIEVVVLTPLTQLSAMTYRHWAMRMEVHLDAPDCGMLLLVLTRAGKGIGLPYQ